MNSETLTALIAKAQSGDQDAVGEILREAHTSVSYQCRKLLRDPRDAEDTTQEVLLAIYSRLDKLKNPAAFWGWVNTITVNRCKNVLTRNHVDLQFAEDEDGGSILDDLEDEDEQQVPDKALDNTETARMIDEIVDSLSEAQRICVLMYYYDEMGVKDIADTLEISENTVKSRLNYARKAVKEKVLDCEKKQGIRLHTLAPLPFLLYFLRRAAQDNADGAAAASVVEKVMGLGSSAATAANSAAAASAANGSGAAVGATAAKGTATAGGILGGLSTKVIVGALIGILAVGGIAGAVVISQRNAAEEPAPTPTLPVATEAVSSEPALSTPVETDSVEESQIPEIPEIPDPVDSPYDTVTEYDPGTYIARTTLITDLDNLEVYFEFPVFRETTSGIRQINTAFRELRDAFFRDEDGGIARALEAARNPMVEGDLYFDNYRCSIETFDDEITSVFLMGDWYIGGVNSGSFPALTFRTDTGAQLWVLDVLPCGRAEYEQYLTRAATDEGIISVADLSGDTTQFPFYVSNGDVYVGVPMTMGHDDYTYVRLDVPAQIGESTPSAPADPSTLLGSIAYYGDPAQCAMDANQALAFAEVIRSQSAELEKDYEVGRAGYEEFSPGMAPRCYAALVDAGNGIPILVCAGGLTNGTTGGADGRKVSWEYLSAFSVWQYVDGRAVQFQPEDGGMGAAVTSGGVWFGWNGSPNPSYEIHDVKGRFYPFQDGGISDQPANTITGSLESFQIDGASVSQQEFEALLADHASGLCVRSSVNGDPSGGFDGVSPAEQVLDVLLTLGGL